MRPNKIARENAKSFIQEKGKQKIISVVFTKKDNIERTMQMKMGVKKNLRGQPNKVMALDRPYLTVYDMNNRGYRTLNIHTLKSITSDGEKYLVV